MKKLLISLFVLLYLCGCSSIKDNDPVDKDNDSTDVENQDDKGNDTTDIENPDDKKDEKQETNDIAYYKDKYQTNNVYVDTFNPTLYLVITNKDVYLITDVGGFTSEVKFKKKSITSIQTNTIVNYVTLLIYVKDISEPYNFITTTDYSDQILDKLD